MLTTADLIDEIRALAAEHDEANWTDANILAAATRGIRYVSAKLAEDYPEPLLDEVSIATTAYNADVGLQIPRDCFENRVLAVAMDTPGKPTEVDLRSSRNVSSHKFDSTTAIPTVAYIRGNRLFLAPSPNGAYSAIMEYVRKPDPYVLPLGRITAVGADYVIVDEPSEDLSSAGDERESYVNVIDHLSGEVKGTLQIGFIESGKLTLRSTPIRSTIYGRTTSGSAAIDDLEIAEDDYVCSARGTCVPQFGDAFTGYVVDYAAAVITRSLESQMASINEAIARRAKEDAAAQRAGRPTTRRIKNRSSVWGGARFTFPRSTNS